MDQKEFYELPISKHAICRCGYVGRDLSLVRDIYDYINGRESYTPLYLCSNCHWQQSCEFGMWERIFRAEFGIDTWEVELTTGQFHECVMILFRGYRGQVAHRNAFRAGDDGGLLVVSGGMKEDSHPGTVI
jgi:hypothetical protein